MYTDKSSSDFCLFSGNWDSIYQLSIHFQPNRIPFAWFQFNRKMVNKIGFSIDLTRIKSRLLWVWHFDMTSCVTSHVSKIFKIKTLKFLISNMQRLRNCVTMTRNKMMKIWDIWNIIFCKSLFWIFYTLSFLHYDSDVRSVFIQPVFVQRVFVQLFSSNSIRLGQVRFRLG